VYFEGPEKKIEILVKSGHPSLRSFGDAFWSKIVEISQAQILSKVSSGACDAYLLSESSLFVTDDRMTMITCGRTMLVNAALALLERIKIEDIELLVYERKNEHFPEYQHSTFAQDVEKLSQVVPGRTVFFGDEKSHHISLFTMDKCFTPSHGDMTLEVLMHGLDQKAAGIFQKGPRRDLEFIRKKTGIWEVLPGFTVDDYLFQPMGYSLNAIRDNLYYTFHVTPQEVGSYASFETNYHFTSDPVEIIERVLKIFRPKESNILFFQKNSTAPVHLNSLPKDYELLNKSCTGLDCGFHVEFYDYRSKN
jgi:S-adenosylmethionine decarboxylase